MTSPTASPADAPRCGSHRRRCVVARVRATISLALAVLVLGIPGAFGGQVPEPVGGGSGPTPPACGPPSPCRDAGPRLGPQIAPRGGWTWPLAPRPRVVRPFDPPASTYGSGHRGVDLLARSGQEVLAVTGGTVTHVGVVAGRGTVTVTHADGVRSTYEPVVGVVRVGQAVRSGQVLGHLADRGWHCPSACLHLGARRGETYLDPLRALRWWRVRLLPMA